MSGTSLDGADAALVQFKQINGKLHCHLLASQTLPFSDALKQELIALHTPSHNELERSLVAGNQLSAIYADTVNQLIDASGIHRDEIAAIGCHGQTVRHRPELGFTLQLGNPSFVAERTGVTVVADFRSRDISAGGQGAPLVPAFHQAVFGDTNTHRAIINIGGIANITNLPKHGEVLGFDTGPGNMLMDAWILAHQGKPYDANGDWAMTGQVQPALLEVMLKDPYFALKPPKSTGRDLFNASWLTACLKGHTYNAEDVQRTLLQLAAQSIADSILKDCAKDRFNEDGIDPVQEIYLCGGGARNHALIRCLQELLSPVKIQLTNDIGIDVGWVEAVAFAWLARQCLLRQPASLPSVTGAKAARILGAVYAY